MVVPEVGGCVWHPMHLHPSGGPPPGTWHQAPWTCDLGHLLQTLALGPPSSDHLSWDNVQWTSNSGLWDIDPLLKAFGLGLPSPGLGTSTADSPKSDVGLGPPTLVLVPPTPVLGPPTPDLAQWTLTYRGPNR